MWPHHSKGRNETYRTRCHVPRLLPPRSSAILLFPVAIFGYRFRIGLFHSRYSRYSCYSFQSSRRSVYSEIEMCGPLFIVWKNCCLVRKLFPDTIRITRRKSVLVNTFFQHIQNKVYQKILQSACT